MRARLPHRRTMERFEDIKWLASFGVPPEEIAARVGYNSADNMYKTLNKWGEHDLSHKLQAWEEERAA